MNENSDRSSTVSILAYVVIGTVLWTPWPTLRATGFDLPCCSVLIQADEYLLKIVLVDGLRMNAIWSLPSCLVCRKRQRGVKCKYYLLVLMYI